MTFAGLVRTSLIDYPGVPACVVFTAGCPYACTFCHNRRTQDGSATIPPEPVYAFLRKRAGLLGGVVVSGGEPTAQPDLETFCRLLKRLGYRVKLDTNGYRPDVVQTLLGEGLLDYLAIDYKAPAARYREICGEAADPAQVLRTIARVHASEVPYELRTTLFPGLTEADLLAMESEIRDCLGTAPNFWRRNEFRPPKQDAP